MLPPAAMHLEQRINGDSRTGMQQHHLHHHHHHSHHLEHHRSQNVTGGRDNHFPHRPAVLSPGKKHGQNTAGTPKTSLGSCQTAPGFFFIVQFLSLFFALRPPAFSLHSWNLKGSSNHRSTSCTSVAKKTNISFVFTVITALCVFVTIF